MEEIEDCLLNSSFTLTVALVAHDFLSSVHHSFVEEAFTLPARKRI